MKRYSIITLIASMAIMGGIRSCQKEELAGGTFSATMERYESKDAKTVYDSTSRYFSWLQNDEIMVYRSNGTAPMYGIYKATSVNDARATFAYQTSTSNPDVTDDATYSGDYHAFSPATVADAYTINADGSLLSLRANLPATQVTDEGGNLISFPMYAESNNQHLQFKNLCGLMRLSLQKANTTISAIRVTTDAVINGTFNIDFNNGDPILTIGGIASTYDRRKSVKLVFPVPQSIDTKRDFFIALPAGEYTSLEIKIYTSDGTHVSTQTMQSGSTLQIARNKYTIVDLTDLDLSFVEIPHLFTVSDMTEVAFSGGNLQWNKNINATWTYRFAENDYDYIGGANISSTSAYNGIVDLFEWSICSGNITVDGVAWRVLTSQEWKYLLETRSASTLNGTANARYVKAKVAGKSGIIIFPDMYAHPSGVTPPSGINNATTNLWNTNVYDADDWSAMKTAGAVFLPAAGYIDRNNWFTSVSYGGTQGWYWANYQSGNKGYSFTFKSNGTTPSSNSRYKTDGASIRLVKDY